MGRLRFSRLARILGGAFVLLVLTSVLAQEPKQDALQEPKQNPVIDATYLRVDPKDTFKFKWKEKGGEFTRTVGLLHWDVPGSDLDTAGMGRNFRTFCARHWSA